MKHYSQSIIVNLSICITSYLSNIQLYVNIFWYIDVFVYFIHLCFCDSFCSMHLAWRHEHTESTCCSLKPFWTKQPELHCKARWSPLPGEMIQFDEHIFQMGWNHQLESVWQLFATTILEIDVRLKLFDMNSTCRSRRLRSIRSLFKRGLDSFWFDIMELTAQLSLKSKKMTLPASC